MIKIRHKITAEILVEIAGADLRYANLRYADLCDADLRNADLRRANLSDANLSYANLRDANLRHANLHNTELRGANLSDANLRDADLRGADLRYANLIDAGQDSRGYQFIAVRHTAEPMIKAGCRWLSLTDARLHWREAHKDKTEWQAECLAIVAHIEAVAIARGWTVIREQKP